MTIHPQEVLVTGDGVVILHFEYKKGKNVIEKQSKYNKLNVLNLYPPRKKRRFFKFLWNRINRIKRSFRSTTWDFTFQHSILRISLHCES